MRKMAQWVLLILCGVLLNPTSNCHFISDVLDLDELKLQDIEPRTLLPPATTPTTPELDPTTDSTPDEIPSLPRTILRPQPARAYSYKVIDEATAYVFENLYGATDTEYIVANLKLKWHQANLYCQHKFKGYLAELSEVSQTEFFQRNLLSTIDRHEVVWINGKYKNQAWMVSKSRHSFPMQMPLFISHTVLSQKNVTNKKCMSFQRGDSSYNSPVFLANDCSMEHRFVCQRRRYRDKENSLHATHTGWIELGERYYKIFADPMTFEDAATKCLDEDATAWLAVALNAWEREQLGRYMTITRPSIQAAWIGGIYTADDQWVFPSEDCLIANENSFDENGMVYPNWYQPRHAPSTNNCLALINFPSGSYFNEQPCNATMQGYICYKNKHEIKKVEYNCANKNYDLSVYEASWQNAQTACAHLGWVLAEPKDDEQLSCLSYIMTELASTPIRHIWLGGQKANSTDWSYVTDNRTVFLSPDIWLTNFTLVPHLDQEYTCLNMDKLSLEKIMFYGTDCNFKQRFVCESEVRTSIVAEFPLEIITIKPEKNFHDTKFKWMRGVVN